MEEQNKKPKYNKADYRLGWNNEIGDDWTDSIPEEEISAYSQAAHRRDSAGYGLSQNALCFEVLGSIALVIGILFVFLSLKKNRKGVIVGINPACMQFVVCLICLSAAAVLLSIGTFNLIRSLRLRKMAKRDIGYLANLNRK